MELAKTQFGDRHYHLSFTILRENISGEARTKAGLIDSRRTWEIWLNRDSHQGNAWSGNTMERAWVGSLNALERRGDRKVRGSMPPFSATHVESARVGSLNCLESSGDRKVNSSMLSGSAIITQI